MTGHSLLVSVLLLLMGGVLLTLNIREALELRDSKNARTAQVAPATGLANDTTTGATIDATDSRAEKSEPSSAGSDLGTDIPGSEPRLNGKIASGANPAAEVNRIPRVRVAALAMPLGVGLLLLLGTVVTWFSKSDQAVQVTATLAGVAGVLMLFLGLEHFGSLLNWGADPLARSALVLITGGLLCLSLPSRWWWSRTNDDSSSNL